MYQKNQNLIGFLKNKSFFQQPNQKSNPTLPNNMFSKFHTPPKNSQSSHHRIMSTKNYHPTREQSVQTKLGVQPYSTHKKIPVTHKPSNNKINYDKVSYARHFNNYNSRITTNPDEIAKAIDNKFNASKVQSKNYILDLKGNLNSQILSVDKKITQLNGVLMRKLSQQITQLHQILNKIIAQVIAQIRQESEKKIKHYQSEYVYELERIKLKLKNQAKKIQLLENQHQKNWRKRTYQDQIQQLIQESRILTHSQFQYLQQGQNVYKDLKNYINQLVRRLVNKGTL